MATKRYKSQSFSATVNGTEYEFQTWTTNTRNGFCHTAETFIDGWSAGKSKQSWCNRTWERFDYETVLKRAIGKCPKKDQEILREIIIERKNRDEHEKAEKFLAAFEKMHNSLNDENKKRLANMAGTITSESQANAVLAIGQFMALTQD